MGRPHKEAHESWASISMEVRITAFTRPGRVREDHAEKEAVRALANAMHSVTCSVKVERGEDCHQCAVHALRVHRSLKK